MAQKELVFKLKFVDENGAIVEKTAQNIKEINKSITDLKNELENTELGSEHWNELAEDLGKAENALGKVGEAQKKAKESTMSFSDSLSAIPGPIGGVIQGAKALNASLLKLVANPIGAVIAAIVLALTALYKAFASTKAGAEKLDQIFAGISAAMDVLRDRVLKVGSALVKFFSGDFSGALEDVKGAVSGVGDEIYNEFNQAMKLKAELQSIADATRELNKERARQNKEIAAAKLVINDETKSIEERKAALEEVRKEEIALAKQEELLAQRRYDAIKAQNALSDSSKEALEEEANAYIALQNAQLASLQKQKELFDQEKALRDKQRAEQKAAADKRKQELQQIADLEQQLNLDLITDAQERAKKEIEINEDKLMKQLKELRVSKAKEAELQLLIQANTQLKLKQLEEEKYKATLDAVNAFRQQLIAQELVYSDAVIKVLEDRANIEIGLMDKQLDRATDTEERRQKELDEFYRNTKKTLDSVKAEYDRYYKTQAYAAYEAYQADINNAEQREKEREKQLADANEVFKRELQKRLQAEQEATGTSIIEIKRFQEIQAQLRTEQGERITDINAYFDNYETNRKLQYNAQLVSIENEHEQKVTSITEKYSAIRNKVRDQEAAAEQARIQLATAGLDAVAELAGRESEVGKMLAVASTTISTYQAAQAAYASQLLIPTPDAPVRAAVAAGIAIAQGLARVASIVKVDTNVKAADGMVVGNGSGRADNIPVMVSNGETIINARSSKMFRGLLSSINQAGGGRRFASGGITSMTTQTSAEQNLLNQIAGSSQAPIKTYVVSTDVSSAQSLDRQIKSRSVL